MMNLISKSTVTAACFIDNTIQVKFISEVSPGDNVQDALPAEVPQFLS